MTIRTISRSEFDQLLPDHSALQSLLREQVEWFSNKSGNLLGAIAKAAGIAGWNYVILKRDKKGDFHVRKVMNNFFNVSAARVDLLLSMASIATHQPDQLVILTSRPPSGSWLAEPSKTRRFHRQCQA